MVAGAGVEDLDRQVDFLLLRIADDLLEAGYAVLHAFVRGDHAAAGGQLAQVRIGPVVPLAGLS